MARELLTTSDAALALGIEPHSIRALYSRGLLTSYGKPKWPRWDVAELAETWTRWNDPSLFEEMRCDPANTSANLQSCK